MSTMDTSAAIDSNDLIMSFLPETTWGVTPTITTNVPQWNNIRLDSEGFSGSKSRTRPNEIDPSGQASAAITTKEESTGSLNCSVSASPAYNTLLAASLGGVFTAAVAMSAATLAISAASTVNKTCTLTDSGSGFVAAGIVLGQFLKVNLSGTANLTGSFIGRVKTLATGSIDFDCVSNPLIATATVGAAAGTVTVKGSMLRNGTTDNSFTFQKRLGTALFMRYAGSIPTGGSLDVGVGDYLKGTLAFLNKAEVSGTTEVTGCTYPGGYLVASTGTVIDSIKGIGTVWRGVDAGTTPGVPAAIQGVVQKIGIKWSKEGSAAQYGMGSAAALGVRSGKMLVTGSVSTYFLNFDLYTQYTSEEAGPISFYAIDGLATVAGTKGYVLTFCNATIMNPKIVAGGPGQDVMADFEIEGNPDISSTQIHGGKTIQIDYFA